MDSIIHEQRQTFYQQRDALVEQKVEITDLVSDYMKRVLNIKVGKYCPRKRIPEEWDLSRLCSDLHLETAERANLQKLSENEDVLNYITQWWKERYAQYLTAQKDPIVWSNRWRLQIIRILDQFWQEHLEHVEQIKQGFHYQSYAQRDPILAYETATWQQFGEMSCQIEMSISQALIREVTEVSNQSELLRQTS